LSPETTTTLLARLSAQLRDAGIEQPRREARLLLAHALGCRVEDIPLHDHLTIATAATAKALTRRRAAHEPLAFLTGHANFWSLTFAVSPATLIPRADSETLIEAALAQFPARDRVRSILDLGTGTGALLLAALSEFRAAHGIGTDRIERAAQLARANASTLGLAHRSHVIVADWAAPLTARFDLILANPPYIPSADIAGLMIDVAHYEPASALDGGADGLNAYRAILADLPQRLAPHGAAILECGLGQAAPLRAMAEGLGFAAAIRNDLSNIPRALIITAPTR
jgi:release factor glutamine methyltransferase